MASYDDRERIYHTGYRDGFKAGWAHAMDLFGPHQEDIEEEEETRWFKESFQRSKPKSPVMSTRSGGKKPKRSKPNSWTRFLKANSSKPWARYKSGPKKGLIKMKEMSRRYRKKQR